MIDAAVGTLSPPGGYRSEPDAMGQRGASGPRHICLVVEGRLLRDCIGTVLQRPDRVFHNGCRTLEELRDSDGVAVQPDLIMVSLARPQLTPVGERFALFETILELRARWPQTRWIVLSGRNDIHFIRDGLKSGIDGFIPDDSPVEVLRLTTEMVLLGHSPLPTGIARRLVDPLPAVRLPPAPAAALPPGPPPGLPPGPAASRTSRPLSSRELDILRCLARGMSNKGIARELAIAEATVKAHVKGLLRKMQVGNRTQAAIAAAGTLAAAEQEPPAPPPPAPRRDRPVIAGSPAAPGGPLLQVVAR